MSNYHGGFISLAAKTKETEAKETVEEEAVADTTKESDAPVKEAKATAESLREAEARRMEDDGSGWIIED